MERITGSVTFETFSPFCDAIRAVKFLSRDAVASDRDPTRDTSSTENRAAIGEHRSFPGAERRINETTPSVVAQFPVSRRRAQNFRFERRIVSIRGVDVADRGRAHKMSESAPSNRSFNPVRRLVFLTALMVFMYLCMRTLRFTHAGLNLAFGCLFLLLPLFAIKPALRLPRWAKVMTLTLLVPLLVFSGVGLLGMVACDIPAVVNHRQLSRELCTLHRGQFSVHLTWEETAGGAVGPHGVSLEQRRTILPGLYAVRDLDYFEGARDGSLSFVGPDKISLNIPIAGYNSDQRDVQRVYSLKPWLYF